LLGQNAGKVGYQEWKSGTKSYVYAQYRTKILRFVDDVEFLFDDTAQLVHFRSASRVGYYDFGLNRRRMIEISKAYHQK
jgi:uncharacterized protein (DUF1499 family)